LINLLKTSEHLTNQQKAIVEKIVLNERLTIAEGVELTILI